MSDNKNNNNNNYKELIEAYEEMYDFCSSLPCGFDGFDSNFQEAQKQLNGLKIDMGISPCLRCCLDMYEGCDTCPYNYK